LRGYDISELTGHATFEEVAHLLWHGKLPVQSQLDDLKAFFSEERNLKQPVIDALRVFSKESTGMDVLRMSAAALSIGYDYTHSRDLDVVEQQAARLQAQMTAIVAHSWRLSQGFDIVEPKPEHGLAQGFLYMLEGKEPSQARIDALDAYFVTVAEHGLNASSFALRIIIGTNSDMVSALTGAIGALQGPAHGGLPGPVHAMLEAIGEPANAEQYIRDEVEAGRRITGFGHSIYKVRDPRAGVLSDAVEKLASVTGERRLLDLTWSLENTAVRVLEELEPGGDHYANVELYSELILRAIGIPSTIFTEVFAVGRTAGWTAHMIDQLEEDRLIRPSSLYVGGHGLTWAPVDARK
jgi:citrate synthase